MKNSDVIRGAETIAQYKIMQFIKDNFMPGALDLELIDDKTVKGTDRNGDSMIFKWERGEVVTE